MNEVKQTNKIYQREYKILKFKITSDNIKNFKIMDNRRQISSIHVGRIHGAILSGKNPIGVLIVNKRGDDLRLIDGNHRIEAVKRFFAYKKVYSKMELECILKVYNGLSDDEERKVYSDEAKRKNESYEDRLHLYKDVITLWKLVTNNLNKFPCKITIYNQKNSLKLRLLINAIYTARISQEKGYNQNYVSKEDIVGFAKEITYDEFLIMKEFIEFFQKIFGIVENENYLTRAQFFIPLFDIYYQNRKFKDQSNFESRFKNCIGRNELLNFIGLAGREAMENIRNLLLKYMNRGISRNIFI